MKWTKDLNVRPETIKFMEENIESSLTVVLAMMFWILTPKAQTIKAKLIGGITPN